MEELCDWCFACVASAAGSCTAVQRLVRRSFLQEQAELFCSCRWLSNQWSVAASNLSTFYFLFHDIICVKLATNDKLPGKTEPGVKSKTFLFCTQMRYLVAKMQSKQLAFIHIFTFLPSVLSGYLCCNMSLHIGKKASLMYSHAIGRKVSTYWETSTYRNTKSINRKIVTCITEYVLNP